MSQENSVGPLGNTGVLPPGGEENAEFENVNMPLGAEGLTVPETAAETAAETTTETEPTMGPKPKRVQSAAQQKTISSQAEERASLKSAGVAKPSVAMVATLASMRTKGDPKYESAFANAIAGKGLNSYRTAKTAKAPRKGRATVINTTAKNSLFSGNGNAATNFMAPSATANSRTNNGAAQNTISSIQTMGDSAISTIREMMRLSTTLTKELAKTNNSAGLAAVANLASSAKNQSMKKGKPRKPRTRKTNSLQSLPPLPVPPSEALPAIPEASAQEENNAYTPPP